MTSLCYNLVNETRGCVLNKIHIGFVQGVHGLRGDLKIKNRFEKTEKVFVEGNKIYLNEEEHTITKVKFYKGHYLTTIDNLKDINLVEKYIGYDVYFAREDLKEQAGDYIVDDLFGLKIVSNGREYGLVKEILDNGKYKILSIEFEKNYMIPLIPEYVLNVDLERKTIEVADVEGLIL